MTWTDDRVELLKKLWMDGLSASQIAAELGGITRNAVIGKVHRLGLSGRAKAPSSTAPRPRKPRPPAHAFRTMRASIRGNTALATQALTAYEMDLEPDARAQRGQVPLADRRPRPDRFFLLRRQDRYRAALLRLPRARRLSAGQRPAAGQAPDAGVMRVSSRA